MSVAIECPSCHQPTEIDVDPYDFMRWKDDPHGPLVQIAFPNLSPAEREVLLTGTCTDCWDRMFPPEEDDEVITVTWECDFKECDATGVIRAKRRSDVIMAPDGWESDMVGLVLCPTHVLAVRDMIAVIRKDAAGE